MPEGSSANKNGINGARTKRLADAYQGITDAWSLGIVKIPAIVIDQRHVIYGEHDVEAAQAKVRQFLRGQP